MAVLLGTALAMMALGLPVAIAFIIANTLGALVFMGGAAGIEQLVANATQSISSFLLVPVPLFILMGDLFIHTGLGVRVFDAIEKLVGRVPGRLCFVAVSGGTVFAALSGSSMASTAMMGSIMVPEMLRRGYKPHMAMGPILGAGGLAIIIPPSALAVLLGSLANIDISALLIAGILPGLLLAVLFAAVIYVQTRLDPEAAPAYDVARVPLREKLGSIVVHVLPMGLVIFSVVGLIIIGIATPTEAAAFGVLSVVVLTLAFRCLTWDAIKKSLEGSMRVTVMVFAIILGSQTFSQILAFSGATSGLVGWTGDLKFEPLVMLAMMFGVLIVLGLFIDQVSQMMLTIPIFMPVAAALGFDPVWFGIIVMLSLEMSALTPPFGLQLFVMMGVGPAGTTLGDVSRAAVPYLLCDLIVVGLIIAFPALALYLPGMIK
ncbi:MAG: TRAP transporter large permease subunit [Alphaproteobacteria bacterium]